MTSEPKAFASLTSGLLARKGAARPAMRPQGFGQLGAGLEDLGWNDLGFEPPRPLQLAALDGGLTDAPAESAWRTPPTGLTPAPSPVHDQRAEIAARLAVTPPESDRGEDERPGPSAKVTPIARASRQARAEPGAKGKSAFTLRLDPERRLKLRLASAVAGRSAQQLVTGAVDSLLAAMPELDALAVQAAGKSSLSSRKG